MSVMNALRKLGFVAAASSGAIITYYAATDSGARTATASWTTGYTPSCKWEWNWDKREATSLVKPSKKEALPEIDENNNRVKSKATRHIILIRHGQYNLDGNTDEDRYLTKLGREQAALTGERLKALSLPLTQVVYSTMTRATETAQIILDKLEDLPVQKCDMIREGAPIPPEPPTGSWRPELHKFHTDGARIEAAFRKYIHRAPASQEEDTYDVLVCHGNVIRYFVCRSLQFPPEAWLRLSVSNGSMTHLLVRPDGRVALKHLGEAGFMPPHAVTFT